ncbi:MAG: cryptochrome/photolyase family protein, partial [Litorivicinaceae bacterium]
YEWVELPNTLGMALFADGGVLASKPYCASGKYIDRMSDYCRGCHYDVKRTVGGNACPFNTLYWDFLMRHATRFQSNPRMAMILKHLPRMSPEKSMAITTEACRFKAHLVEQGDDLTWQGGADAH